MSQNGGIDAMVDQIVRARRTGAAVGPSKIDSIVDSVVSRRAANQGVGVVAPNEVPHEYGEAYGPQNDWNDPNSRPRAVGVPGEIPQGPGMSPIQPGDPGYERASRGSYHPTLKRLILPGEGGYEDAVNFNKMSAALHPAPSVDQYPSPESPMQAVKMVRDAIAQPNTIGGILGGLNAGRLGYSSGAADVLGTAAALGGSPTWSEAFHQTADELQQQASPGRASAAGQLGGMMWDSVPTAAMILASRGQAAGRVGPIVSGAATYAGLGTMAAASAGQGIQQYRDTLIARRENPDPKVEAVIGAGYAAAEIIFEKVGIDATGEILHKAAADVTGSLLRRDVAGVARFILSAAEAGGVNATEEGATQLAQNLIDRAYDPGKDLEEGVAASAVGGAMQGIGLAGSAGVVGAGSLLTRPTRPESESSKPTPPRPKAVPREDAEPVTPPPSRGGTDLHPEVAKAIADLEARLTGKANEAGTPATSAAEPAAPGVPSTPDDAAMARVLADLGIDPAAFEARVQEERDRGLIDADPRTLSPEDRERQKRAVAAEVNRRAKAFQSSPQYQAEEARKAEMLRLAQERPNDRGGDPNEGGAVAGGVRSPGPDRMPGRDGVDVPQDVRPVENRVAPMVGHDGSQAGDQPGDVGVGRSAAEVAAERDSVAKFFRGRDDAEMRSVAHWVETGVDNPGGRNDAYAEFIKAAKAYPDEFESELQRRKIREPQQPGAVTAATQREGASNGQGQEEGRPQGLLTNEPAAPEQGSTGVFSPPPEAPERRMKEPWKIRLADFNRLLIREVIDDDEYRRLNGEIFDLDQRAADPELPRDEVKRIEAEADRLRTKREARDDAIHSAVHRASVESAVAAGKHVSPEVLAYYPDLANRHAFSPPPAGAEQSAPSVSPNLDSMSHDQLREYAKSVGVPPRGSPDGIRARIRKAEADRAALSAKGNPAISDSSTVTASTPEYAALPAKTHEAFEAAYAARDVEKLAEYLDPRNKVLRAEFAARAGLERMPPGITRTRAAVEAWAASSQSPSAPSGAPVPSRSSEPSPQPTTSRAPESAASPAASSTPGSSGASAGTTTGEGTASTQSTPKSNIQKAREKAQARREAKVLDTQVNTREYGVVTRRDLVDRELADGYTPETVEVTDTAAVKKAEDTKALMDKRGNVPLGNPNHPETIRYRELQKTLMSPPKVPEYRMNKGDRYRVLTKIEYDYAAGKAKESTPAQVESKPDPYAADIAKLTPLLDKVLNSKDIPRKQAVDVGIVLNGEAPKVQEALASRLWEKSPEVAEYVVKDGPIGVRSVVQKARPEIETRAGLGLRQNSAGKWAWFDGDSQKTGAYVTADEARQSPEIEAIESNRKRSEEPASPTSIKSHPEYARLHRMYGASSREQIQAKIDQMTADIADHARAARREFTGQGTRRTGAAVSAQAVRDIGNEKLLLTAYMNERFPAKPATGQSATDGNVYAGGKAILSGGMAMGERMAEAERIHKEAKGEKTRNMAMTLWEGINSGKVTADFADSMLASLRAEVEREKAEASKPATLKVASATPDVAPKEAPKPSGFLSNLSAADQARAEELRQKLAKKLAQQRSTLSMNAGGFDPEMLSLGAEYASLHIKAGAKRFAVFAREMVTNLGDGIKPYLRALYSAARQMPGVDKAGTDSGDYVDSLTDADIDAMVGGKTEETPTTDATVTGAQDEAAVSATPERTLDAIASEFRDRMRQEWTPENLEAIGALRREANARFGIENLENVPTAQQPPRPAAVIQKDIDALQKRIDSLHANYKGPGRGGTRAQTTTYNANVGRLAESMGALKDELKRAQAAEPTATDKSAKSIMSEMLAEQRRWYQEQEASPHQQVQEWLRGGDIPARIVGDSNGRPIRANISESALERRALNVRSTRNTAVAVVQDAKSRMWFIVSLPVTSLDPYTFVADSPFAHSDDYEVWRRYPYVGSTTMMDALASQYQRAWSKENPNVATPPESTVLATGPLADQPITATDAERIDFEDGTHILRHTLSDGTFVDEVPGDKNTPATFERWRRAGPGREGLGQYLTLEEAMRAANTRTTKTATADTETTTTKAPPSTIPDTTRQATIDAIVEAARKPRPEIVGRLSESMGHLKDELRRAQEAKSTGRPSAPTPPRVKKFRDMAARLMAQAEALEKNSSRRFDSAPGAAVTGGSGRHRSGLHEKTNRAIEGSLDDLRKAKRLREAAGKWNARADNLDPEVIRQREQRKAVVLEAREKVKAKESAERKAAPIINEDGEGVLRITADEWKKADKDYKGLSIRGGVRVRTLLRGGSLHEVFITDMPVKTREEAKRSQAAETKATPVPESAQPITIVGDAERIEFEGGGSMLRYSLSDGSFLDEAEGRVTHWRPVGPGRQTWGIFEASAEDALADINGIRTVRVQKSSETAQTTTPPAKPDEIGKYRVFERPGEGWAVNWTDQSGATQGRRGLKTREEAESLAREWDARDKENEADRRSRHPMTLAEYPKVRDRIMSGQQTAEEHKDLARWLVRSEEAIKAELDSRTLKQLAPNGVRSGTTKAEVVSTIYRNMLSRFHLGDSVSYNPFAKETYESALLKQIEATTDADIAAFVEKRQKAVDARKKALENPETLDEFRQFIEKNGEAALSVEQRKKYDELTAAVNKRMRGDDRPDYIAKVDTGGVQLTVKEGFHEKQGIPLWIVQMSGRVDSDAYKALVEAAKKLGGWWSSFKKESTGFQFKTKAAADEFVQINQKSITTETTDKAREETQAEKAAARLIEMADAKIEAADEELGRDRNTNTVRRARMADSAEAGARKAKQMAETLANIAEGIQNGTAKALRGIRNMAQLEELERSLMLAQREYWYSLPEESRRAIDRSGHWWELPLDENIIAKAVMPMPEPHKDHVRAIASSGMTTPGIKREAAKLDKLWRYSEKRNPDSPVVTIDNPYDFNAAKAVASRLKGAGAAKYAAESVYDALMHHQRVADMGIKSSAEMRVALREYMGFRVGQAQPDAVREMERGLIGKTVGIDFFPTPPALASEVVDKADIEPGMKVLEPSAGNGRIADAIKAAGVTPDVAEVSGNLRAILEKKGYPLEGRDFMEFNPGPVYDRIVMNPPFSNRMDVEHVRHAYDLLKPGGRIVAIMSEGPFFGRDKKASEFRDWLDTVGTSEQLPEGSFESDKSGLPTTGVNARVVVIDKPQAGEKFSVSYGSQKVGEFTVSGATPKVGDTLLTKDSGVTHGRWLVEKVGEPKGGNTTIDLREIGNRRNSQQIAWPDQSGEFWSESGSPADPLHDKVMDFRQRLNDATKRSDLTGMEDEARMLADAADRANRPDLITMARGFVGQVQEKSGRLAAQEYRAKQEADSASAAVTNPDGTITFADMPTRSEERRREYAAMGYQDGGLTGTLAEAQKRIRDNGIDADIAKEADGYRILRKHRGTPALTPEQLADIRERIRQKGGLGRLDGPDVGDLDHAAPADLRYLLMRYIAEQDVPRVSPDAKNAAHDLMGEKPAAPASPGAMSPEQFTAALQENIRLLQEARSAFYRDSSNNKTKSRAERDRLEREADAKMPEIAAAVEAAIGEYPGDIPSEKPTTPAAGTPEAAEVFRKADGVQADMEELWAQERELDREVDSKKSGSKVREAAEKRREKLRETIREADGEWKAARARMIRMRQEHAYFGSDPWRKLGVLQSWYPGKYSEVAAYLTRAADHIIAQIAPQLTSDARDSAAREAVSKFLESPMVEPLTARIDSTLYVHTKKANQAAAIKRVNEASPLQTNERTKFIREIEQTDKPEEMDRIAKEAEALAKERDELESRAAEIQREADEKQRATNTAALTNPEKMRVPSAKQALGSIGLAAGAEVNGGQSLVVFTRNIDPKAREQFEKLPEDPTVYSRLGDKPGEKIAKLSKDMAAKADKPITILGALSVEGEPMVLFTVGDSGDVMGLNGKRWAYANSLAKGGEWRSEGPNSAVVLFSGTHPVAILMPIASSHTPPVHTDQATQRAGNGWKGDAQVPKTYLTPKNPAPSDTIDDSAFPTLEDLGIKTTNADLTNKAEDATRAYHAALEEASRVENQVRSSVKDADVIARAKAMSGDENPSSGFQMLAVDKLIREEKSLVAAKAAVEAASAAMKKAETAVATERARAQSAFAGEAEQKYRDTLANKKWWQLDNEAAALERLWATDPRIPVLRDMATTASASFVRDAVGEILPPDFKPGVGIGNYTEPKTDLTTDRPSALGIDTKAMEDRVKARGVADWTLQMTPSPGDHADKGAAWLAGDRVKALEGIARIAKAAPEFRADPVLTAANGATRLVWESGNERFAFVNPWHKSVEEPGPIADGQTLRIDPDTIGDVKKRMWVSPVKDKVEVAGTSSSKKALTLLEKLDKAAADAVSRIKKRGIQNRGRTSGATTLIDDTLDAAVVVAAKAVAGGIRGGQKLTRLVSDVLASLKAAGGKSAVLDDVEGVRKVARKLLRDAGGMDAALADHTAILRAYAANREALDRRRTRNVGKAVGDTAGVKAAVAGEARERPGVTKPGDAREARLLNQVQQGENREASARAAGEQAGFRAGQAVGEQTGGAKVRSSAAREIVRSRREAYKAGVAEAKAGIPAMVRQLRQEQTRQRQTAEIERRGAVDATKAVSDQEAAIREGIRKLAQKLPMPVRGKFLRAVEASSKPLHLARAVRDMSKALSRYEAARAARAASKWGSPAYLKRLTNAEREIVRGHMRTVKATWQTVKEAGTNADQMYAAARALEDAYRAIRTVYAQHYAETHAIKALRGETAKEAAAQAVENIERAKKPMAESERVEDVDANAVTKLGRGFMDLRNATESVEGKHDGTGVLYNLMHRVMTMAEDAYFTEKRKRYAQIEKAVKAAGFDGLADAFEKLTGAGGKALQSTIRVPLGGQARTISLGQAASLAAIDPSSEDLISRGMKVQMREGRFLTPMAVTMDEIDRLRLRLKMEHPGLLRMVAAFKGIMEEMRPDVFRVHRILKGFEPEIVHDRWPRVRNLSAGENTQSLPESSHEMVNRVLENSGFLKERTGGTDAPMMVDDVLNVVFDQVDQAAKVTHIALPVRDAANVLLDTRVRTAIASRWGGKFYTDLKRMLMASSRANQVLNTPGARIVSGLNANLAVSALATNVGTYLRQAAGLTRLTPYLSAADWAHGVASVPKVSMKEMTDASGYLWDRYIGSPAGRMSPVMSEGAEAMDRPGIGRAMRQTIANVKAGDIWSAYKAWQRGGKAIMEGVNLADSIVARAAWAGFMRQAEREHPEWSGKKRAAWAAEQTADVVRETQNGSSPLDLSINSAMARDSGMAAFFLFTSDPLKARNRIARAYKKSLADGAKQTAAEAASILLGMAMARGAGWAISQGVAAALGGDDRDRKRITNLYFAPERILANAAREVAGDVAPILGPALTDLLTSSYNRGGAFDPPVLSALNDIAAAVGSIKTAVMANGNKQKKLTNAFVDFMTAVDGAAGLDPFHSLWTKIWGEWKHHRR